MLLFYSKNDPRHASWANPQIMCKYFHIGDNCLCHANDKMATSSLLQVKGQDVTMISSGCSRRSKKETVSQYPEGTPQRIFRSSILIILDLYLKEHVVDTNVGFNSTVERVPSVNRRCMRVVSEPLTVNARCGPYRLFQGGSIRIQFFFYENELEYCVILLIKILKRFVQFLICMFFHKNS